VPVAGLALILGIDRFMSEARALTNLVGNAVATLVVARWTGDLDMAQLNAHLDAPTPLETEEPEVILDAKTEHMDLSGPAAAAAQAEAAVDARTGQAPVSGSPVPVAN
jgi:aerobic C4-dicarboxylate transport protein